MTFPPTAHSLMLLEFLNFHPREGEYLWLSQTTGLPKAQPPWSHASTSCPEDYGTLGSRVTCFTKGLPSLGALGIANPKLIGKGCLAPEYLAVSPSISGEAWAQIGGAHK